MNVGGFSATGPREANEDNYCAIDFSSVRSFANGITAFVMVSDGMGGYQQGDIASGLAISSAESYISQLLEMAKGNQIDLDAAYALSEIAQNAHEAILAKAHDCGYSGMGATFIAAFVSASHVWIGHIGDSRAYLIRGNEITQLTEDHSQVGRMLSSGLITEHEAQTHPARNRIERALGFSGGDPEITEAAFVPGDALLLCSDGVYTVLDKSAIESCVSNGGSAESIARRVVRSSLDAGTDDNTTAIVVLNREGASKGVGRRMPQPTTRVNAGAHARKTPVKHRRSNTSSKRHDRMMKKRAAKRRFWALAVPIALAFALGLALVAFFNLSNGANVGAISDLSPDAHDELQGEHQQAASVAQPVDSGETLPESIGVYVADGGAELKYIDSSGIVHRFIGEYANNGLTIYDDAPCLIEGASVLADSETDNYGQKGFYRKLDEEYLNDLRSDCDAYRAGVVEYESGLASIIDQSRYAQLVSALAENGVDYEIMGLVTQADNLVSLRDYRGGGQIDEWEF